MDYVEHLNILGTEAKEIPCITGKGAPPNTAGAVGLFYMDTDTGNVYKCISIVDGIYIWENTLSHAVFYTAQTLNDEQKKQVRDNIGTAGKLLTSNGGEIFNDYENNDSNIPYAHITGNNNKAIIRCFYIKSFTADTIFLDSVEGIEVGMPWNVFCDYEGGSYSKHRGVILRVDSTNNSVTIFSDGIQITNIDKWGIHPSSKPTFRNTFICNGGLIGTDVIEDIECTHFSVSMSGENNIGYINARIHGTGNKGLAYNAIIDGYGCIVKGERGVALNYKTAANGDESVAINLNTQANAQGTFAQGSGTIANAKCASTFGTGTQSDCPNGMARGQYNTLDAEGKYIDIVGNGTSKDQRSNAYTLDKEGNAEYAGYIRAQELYLRNESEPYAGLLYKGTTSSIPVQGASVGDCYKLTKDTAVTVNKYRLTNFGNRKLKPEDGVIMSDSYKGYWFPNSMVHYEDFVKILDGSYKGSKICDGSAKINSVDITFKKPRKLFIYLHSGAKESILEACVTGVKVDTENEDIKFLGDWVDDRGIESGFQVPASYYQWYYTDNVYHDILELYNSKGENIDRTVVSKNRFPDGTATNEVIQAGSEISFPENSLVLRSPYDGWVALVGNYTTEEDVSNQINTHNTGTSAHSDIRLLITELTNRLNALADSDDITLDQLSEIVAYIKSNKELLDAITTSKVNVKDIVDNLTTNVSDKPLSAAQGVALKVLIDAIKVPTKVSELSNDSGYITKAPVTSVNGKTGEIQLSASDVNADTAGTAESKLNAHNVDESAHSDIREQIDQLSEQTNNIKQEVTEIKIDITQQKPLFANDISECTDISQVYVLPDGYIYAYMYTLIYPYKNQIPLSFNQDGSPFIGPKGEIGYDGNLRIAHSNHTEVVKLGVGSTGYIRVNKGDILYFKDYNFYPGRNDTDASIQIYKSDFTDIPNASCLRSADALLDYHYLIGNFTVDEDGKATSCQIIDAYNNGITYLRFVASGLNNSTIITVNEEITEPLREYQWTNTGHQFIPADYEDRIIETEKSIKDHEERIQILEEYGGSSSSSSNIEIPAYIKAEAEEVMSRLIEKQGNRVFNMIAMSDFHYSNYAAKYGGEVDDNRVTLLSVAKATSYMLDRIHIDAVATLGDNTPFGAVKDSDIEWGHKWHKEINEILTMTQRPGIVDFRTVGNHDRMGGNDAEGNPTPILPDGAVYQYIQGYNRQCDYLSAPVGYGYKDFEGYKLRVIVLNTAECEGKGRFDGPHYGYFIGNAQYNWLIKTLDMNTKEDASEWQILILSHHRADDAQVAHDENSHQHNAFILANILNAYKTGSSYSGTISEEGISVSCNFAGKNQAYLIGQIHGHHHNHAYSNLYLGAHNNSTQTSIMAVGTPTTSYGTTNPDNDGIAYTSTAKGTADETTFSVYAIDLDEHKIYSINYGKGPDREIDY